MSHRTAWLRSRLAHRVNGAVQSRVQADGIDVADRAWDTLIVMDACRADLFERADHDAVEQFDTTTAVTSPASATPEWLARAWPDEYPDTVYVAGNPLVSRHAPDRWHDLEAVWYDGWDADAETILPEAVTAAAKRVHNEYPRKRVVVHYLQPHAPLLADGEWDGWQAFGDLGVESGAYRNIWEAAGDGAVSTTEVWERYQATLAHVLDEVDELLETVDGRVALTSDHGNLMGERGWPLPIKQYGHPPGLRQPAARRVPWAVRDGPRRRIVAGEVMSATDDSPTTEQLEALGYA